MFPITLSTADVERTGWKIVCPHDMFKDFDAWFEWHRRVYFNLEWNPDVFWPFLESDDSRS